MEKLLERIYTPAEFNDMVALNPKIVAYVENNFYETKIPKFRIKFPEICQIEKETEARAVEEEIEVFHDSLEIPFTELAITNKKKQNKKKQISFDCAGAA